MRLINNLYTISDKTEGDGCFAYRISLNAEHEIYRAHFPGNPITPGVCIMQMATEILGQRLGKTLQVTNIRNMKFRKALSNKVEPVMTFSKVIDNGDEVTAKVSIEADGTQYVNMTLKMA